MAAVNRHAVVERGDRQTNLRSMEEIYQRLLGGRFAGLGSCSEAGR